MDDEASATRFFWVNVGDTYAAVDRDHMVALVYFSDRQIGFLDGPDGEMLLTDYDWYWVPVDDPQNHVQVTDAPPLRQGMSESELAQATDQALAAAAGEIVDYLTRRGQP